MTQELQINNNFGLDIVYLFIGEKKVTWTNSCIIMALLNHTEPITLSTLTNFTAYTKPTRSIFSEYDVKDLLLDYYRRLPKTIWWFVGEIMIMTYQQTHSSLFINFI